MKSRMRIAFRLLFQCAVFIFIGCCSTEGAYGNSRIMQLDTSKAFTRNKIIGRGINFGNALEAPNEGEWGLTIKEKYIQAIAEAGFNSVRLPICWSAHTGNKYPYDIAPGFLQRIDEVMSWCLKRKLAVIITIHHFDELYNFPDDTVYRNMVFSIWKQLSNHYILISHDSLFFEVMNEPEVNLTSDKWNLFLPQIIDSIRKIDVDRTLIIDGPDYAYHGSLVKLVIPETEQNVIVSTRYYLPMNFAQQGAWWMPEMKQYIGTTWSGKSTEKNTVLADMAFILNWSKTHNRPITIGEYGSIMYADNQSRLTWTNYIRTQFEVNGFSWSYFDFGVAFKAYSIAENKWLPGFVKALTGSSAGVSDGRSSDSLRLSPDIATEKDTLRVSLYITIPNFCSPCDSLKKTVTSSSIKIAAYHSEHIPGYNGVSTCMDSLSLGRLSTGSYTVIFNSEYIDQVNTLRYSIVDSAKILVVHSTGINFHNTFKANVYPNPASHYIITENFKDLCQYQIFNLYGQLKLTGKIGDGRINISELKPGEYVLRIMENGRVIMNKKVVISGSLQ
jgi:endoglucanase